ncbi:MAG: DUF3891 family protein [Actinomycetota bacterium]
MILQPREPGLLAIRQPDHARLAGMIAEVWRGPQGWRPEPWEPVVAATNRHDDGWAEWESAPTVDGGGKPYDFLRLPVAERVTIYRKGIDMVAAEDLHAGVLVSMHLTGLMLGGFEPGSARALDSMAARDRALLEPFLDEQLRWQADVGPRLAHAPLLHAQFRVVKLLDRLSLLVCMRPLPEVAATRLEYVPVSDEGLGNIDLAVRDGHVLLDPYPLATEPFVGSVAATPLEAETFADAEELRASLRRADPIELQIPFAPTA